MDNNISETVKGPSRRGFAAMTPEERSKIARLGGIAAHKRGTAHQFSTAEAIAAGKLRAQNFMNKRVATSTESGALT